MHADDVIRSQLLGRREQVGALSARVRAERQLDRLLLEIDSALERLDNGTYGECAVCHESIEPDRLARNPLLTLCLDHLDAAERRALEDDLELALRVQEKLLPPRVVSCAGWESCYEYQPAGLVGGDFCDIIECAGKPERLFFAVGDVAGKGVAASILMSNFHAMLRTLVAMDLPLTRMLDHANRLFCEATLTSHYATLVCGYAGPAGEVELCNAGHCRPLLVRNGGVEAVDTTGLPAGLFCEAQYEARSLSLRDGEALLIYTDGVTEARNGVDEEYGSERLAGAFAQSLAGPLPDAVSACVSSLNTFLAGARKRDDVTLLILRRGASAPLSAEREEQHKGDREYRQYA